MLIFADKQIQLLRGTASLISFHFYEHKLKCLTRKNLLGARIRHKESYLIHAELRIHKLFVKASKVKSWYIFEPTRCLFFFSQRAHHITNSVHKPFQKQSIMHIIQFTDPVDNNNEEYRIGIGDLGGLPTIAGSTREHR